MIYLDNAATTKPNAVAVEKATPYLSERFFNPSGLYKEGFDLNVELKETRKKLVSFIADKNKFELIFTSGGTESDNTAVFLYGKRGNIVISAGEHSAIMSAVKEQKNRGTGLKIVPLKIDGSVNKQALLDAIDENTSFVSIMHVNNETGAINDINDLAECVKQKNANVIFHSDGVQAFGKLKFRLNNYIDLYSVSAHKIGGIKGTGGLIKRKTLHMNPFIFGGGQENGLRSGTENVFGIKVFEYAVEEKYKSISEDAVRLKEYKKLFIQKLNKDIFYSISAENSSPYILCVSAKGCRGEILMHMVDDNGLVIGTGSACSSNSKNRYSRVILACGYDEKVADTILRISFSESTTLKEVEEAISILNRQAEILAKKMV